MLKLCSFFNAEKRHQSEGNLNQSEVYGENDNSWRR